MSVNLRDHRLRLRTSRTLGSDRPDESRTAATGHLVADRAGKAEFASNSSVQGNRAPKLEKRTADGEKER